MYQRAPDDQGRKETFTDIIAQQDKGELPEYRCNKHCTNNTE